MFIKTSSNLHGHEKVFVSFERTDIVQVRNITFFYNRYSILTNSSKKSMCIFRFQFSLEHKTWSTQYSLPRIDRYSLSSTDWTLSNLNFTVEIFGIKLNYDQNDTTHADMCFGNVTITHSVY